MRHILFALVVPALSIACAAQTADESTDADGAEALSTGARASLSSLVVSDVRDHARRHVATSESAALDALTKEASAQAAVKAAIGRALPEGSSSPYFGDVTSNGTTFMWVDAETDEGEGPTQQGTTFVFSSAGRRVLSLQWFGAHDYP
jgi:hypothetical protein